MYLIYSHMGGGVEEGLSMVENEMDSRGEGLMKWLCDRRSRDDRMMYEWRMCGRMHGWMNGWAGGGVWGLRNDN